MVHHIDIFFTKYHDQKFYIKTAFPGQHWTGISIAKFCKYKIIESAKVPAIYGLLFLIATYSPINDNKHSSETNRYYTFLNFCELWSSLACRGFSSLNLFPCFDILFSQLGVIPRTRSNFVQVVAEEHYLIITQGIKETAVPNELSHKSRWWKNVNNVNKKFLRT